LVEPEDANEHSLFTTSSEKGFFAILINRHLIHGDKKFREFFRLNIDQFNYVRLIEKDNHGGFFKSTSIPIHPYIWFLLSGLAESYKQSNYATSSTSFSSSMTVKSTFVILLKVNERASGCVYTARRPGGPCGFCGRCNVVDAFKETYPLDNIESSTLRLTRQCTLIHSETCFCNVRQHSVWWRVVRFLVSKFSSYSSFGHLPYDTFQYGAWDPGSKSL